MKNAKSFLTSALENVRTKQNAEGDEMENTTDDTNATKQIVTKVVLFTAVAAAATVLAVKLFSNTDTEDPTAADSEEV